MKKTKFISFLLVFIMVFISMFVGATPVHAGTSGDYTYTDNEDGTCSLTDYKGSAASVEIPATLGGLTVVSIKSEAFFLLNDLTSVTNTKRCYVDWRDSILRLQKADQHQC